MKGVSLVIHHSHHRVMSHALSVPYLCHLLTSASMITRQRPVPRFAPMHPRPMHPRRLLSAAPCPRLCPHAPPPPARCWAAGEPHGSARPPHQTGVLAPLFALLPVTYVLTPLPPLEPLIFWRAHRMQSSAPSAEALASLPFWYRKPPAERQRSQGGDANRPD